MASGVTSGISAEISLPWRQKSHVQHTPTTPPHAMRVLLCIRIQKFLHAFLEKGIYGDFYKKNRLKHTILLRE